MEKNSKTRLVRPFFIVVGLVATFFLISPQNIKSSKFKTFTGDAVIKFSNKGYFPNNIRIKKGAKVTFINESEFPHWPASDLHPSHLIYSEFDSKKPVLKGESWSFVFTIPSEWTYHDHLHPTFVGKINVSDEYGLIKGKLPKKIEDCNTPDLSEKQQCWNQLLAVTVRTKNLDAAFSLFIQLYKENSSVPKSCHGWAHILGKEAYQLFKDKKHFVLREETSYCGYGFFHGFIEQLVQDIGDIERVKDFCEYASGELSEDPGVYGGCIHGFGHGSVNVDDPSLWGNFQKMIQPGLDNCEQILPSSEDAYDLRTCWDGAFNAMQQNINDELYGLRLNEKDFFGFCRVQEEKYKMSCYFEFVGLLSRRTDHDFGKAISILLSENLSEEILQDSVLKLAADFMQDDIVNTDQNKNLADCRSLRSFLYKKCFEGILNGFISHGEPGKQYIKGFAFCENGLLKNEEKLFCYRYLIDGSIPKNSPICTTIPENYREYCLERS